ncbi:MAG: hypothetical protein COU68_04275 [Candidatus Pacebacteria bacterium CG10_big_fil_rev_8_21_14_0_10_45_6]|nr:MAG: hypothetical protein COU68_04275 [Candidatus Pacebacteria bacterium CG10_big_fil_rev_8_21_14_0_10_45_6]
MSEESPILRLPEDPAWQALLQQKKTDYRTRIQKRNRDRMPPELQNTQAEYALLVLLKLFDGSEVASFALSRELAALQTKHFDSENFQQACAVIDRYTTDLPFLEQHLPAQTN